MVSFSQELPKQNYQLDREMRYQNQKLLGNKSSFTVYFEVCFDKEGKATMGLIGNSEENVLSTYFEKCYLKLFPNLRAQRMGATKVDFLK